jgi:hypothetical protein
LSRIQHPQAVCLRMQLGGDLLEYYVAQARSKGGVYEDICDVVMDMTFTWSENLAWAEHMAYSVCHERVGDAEAYMELVCLLGEVLEQGVN